MSSEFRINTKSNTLEFSVEFNVVVDLDTVDAVAEYLGVSRHEAAVEIQKVSREAASTDPDSLRHWYLWTSERNGEKVLDFWDEHGPPGDLRKSYRELGRIL